MISFVITCWVINEFEKRASPMAMQVLFSKLSESDQTEMKEADAFIQQHC